MNKIVVIGSVALDTITTPSCKSKNVLGGSATYFSIAASFFTGVNLVATVGRDFPIKHKSLIKSFGVNMKGLETKEGKTFRWEGSYIDDLNCAKTIKTELNVFETFTPNIPKGYEDSKFIFLANIDPDLQIYILKQFKEQHIIGCDSMNHWIQSKAKSLKKLMKKVTILFLNDAEAKLFSEESNILKAGKYLLSLGPKYAIIKRGEFGSILFSKNTISCIIPAYLLETVKDPTGAGDTFAGGFMGRISRSNRLNNKTLRDALLYGSAMASFAVEDFSVNRFLKLGKKEIKERCDKFRNLIKV